VTSVAEGFTETCHFSGHTVTLQCHFTSGFCGPNSGVTLQEHPVPLCPKELSNGRLLQRQSCRSQAARGEAAWVPGAHPGGFVLPAGAGRQLPLAAAAGASIILHGMEGATDALG